MYNIITFGSATWDTFIKPKKFSAQGGPASGWQIIKDSGKFITGRGICFNLGSKVEIEKIFFASGGGGTNTAATFAKQGFKTAFCGSVGNDLPGQEIINELKRLNINSQLVERTKIKPTNHSIILSGAREDRTIFVYRGASEILGEKDIPWKKLRSKWFYIAPLSGKLCAIFEKLVNFAYKNKIKIAVNPGNCQLVIQEKALKRILGKVDILVLNQEEASLLTDIPYKEEVEIFKKIDKLCPGIAIMTKGQKGVVVSDGEYLYRAGTPNTRVLDRTGAGDSFASGFVSGFIRSNGNIEYSIQLGSANASSCLKRLGAKEGILKQNEKFKKIKVEKELCYKNKFCSVKK